MAEEAHGAGDAAGFFGERLVGGRHQAVGEVVEVEARRPCGRRGKEREENGDGDGG